jgi:hypothetical protein
VGDGATDARAGFAKCDAAARAAGARGAVSVGTYLLRSDVALGAFMMERGALIKPARGVTVTFTDDFDAGTWRVFDLSLGGAVRFTALSDVDEAWFGGPADGTSDDVPFLQHAVDSFGSRRGTLRFRRGHYRATSATLDARRVDLVGSGVPSNSGGGGGTVLRFAAPFGVNSSVEENFGFSISDMEIRGADGTRQPRNGQVLVDFTGQNYPRMSNARLGYAEIGLRLSPGKRIECHYGAFYNVQFDRCYAGVDLQIAHSQKFFGGRFWDCAVGASNTGSNDIAFLGSEFESDMPVRHPDGGHEGAETTLVCCRDESRQPSQILQGELTVLGGGWSGYSRPAEFRMTNGDLASTVAIRSVGAYQDNQPVRPNYLRNVGLQPAPDSTTEIPGWQLSQGTDAEERHSPYGRMLKITRGRSSACVIAQSGIKLRRGTYHVGCGIAKDSSNTGNFSADLVVRSGAAELLRAAIPTSYFGGIYRKSFSLPSDGEIEYRIELQNFANLSAYLYSPYVCKGPNAARYSLGRQEANPFEEGWGAAPPSVGSWNRGDKVWSTEPAAGGFMGWVCVAGGAPGTWRGFGAIQA